MQRRVRSSIITVLVISLILISLNALGWLKPVRIVADEVFAPITRGFDNTIGAVVDGLRLLGSVGSLNAHNKQLEDEVADLKQQLANVKEISLENDALRAQLNFAARQNFQLTPARVVGYEPDNVRKFFTIDRGSSAGLKSGMAVTSNGALVGLIDKVNTYSSQVFLVSDPDFRIRALGQDNRALGIIQGQIGQGYVMDQIAQSDIVKTGETIITAGSDVVPKGIIIGTVESVEHSDNAVFQTADIKPPLNLNKIELVSVITSVIP